MYLEKDIPTGLIGKETLSELKKDTSVELLILNTKNHRNRGTNLFWKKYPGFHPNSAAHLKEIYPNLRALGMDTISLSSPDFREEGRQAHKAFLSREILLIEDMNLSKLSPSSKIQSLTVAPLIFERCDGAPCTIFAEVL